MKLWKPLANKFKGLRDLRESNLPAILVISDCYCQGESASTIQQET